MSEKVRCAPSTLGQDSTCASCGMAFTFKEKPVQYFEMTEDFTTKSIDFDQVADLYDSYVNVDFDIEFWKQEALAANGNVLELMCGTGRIGLPLIEACVAYTGMDYCQNQITQFQNKLASSDRYARLVFGDARAFDLQERFDLVFIGFSSLSEVVENRDKTKVLQSIRAHLAPSGCFTFSLHNPAVRNLNLDLEHVFEMGDGSRTLEFSARFQPPTPAGIVTGMQRYVIKDRDGNKIEERELKLTFHLVGKDEIETLLQTTGFRVDEVWGDFDRSRPNEASPFMIFRCSLAHGGDEPIPDRG